MQWICDKDRQNKCQPCCGFFLQGGVKAIAIIDVLLALYSLVTTITLVLSEINIREEEKISRPSASYVRLYLWAWFTFQHVSVMCLSIFLFLSAHKRNSKHCIYWMIISSILSIIWYINYCIYINWLGILADSVTSITQMQFVLLYKIYALWVVYSFIQEIRAYGGFNDALRGLTDADVEEFVKGSPPAVNAIATDDPQYKPYNSNYEIKPEDINIDNTRPLGKGAYGTVLRAKCIVDFQLVLVAVKTVNQTADTIYFKALLQELKIMTNIGRHENIVNLIGAVTSKIKEKLLYIVVEFCPHGSLHDYLKSNRNLYFNQIIDDTNCLELNPEESYQNFPIGESNLIRTIDLIQWSLEIAEGMSYLGKKSVVHGDLAARNILLATGRKAKITDFGLSKQLYSNPNYVKKRSVPLPWRWMAIESLKELAFSTKSDVWSYGILLWEIFSLGEIPYPGLFWSQEFITQLENGLRLTKPVNCSNEIYDLLLECWRNELDTRVTFEEIIRFFSQILQKPAKDKVQAKVQKEEPIHYYTNLVQ